MPLEIQAPSQLSVPSRPKLRIKDPIVSVAPTQDRWQVYQPPIIGDDQSPFAVTPPMPKVNTLDSTPGPWLSLGTFHDVRWPSLSFIKIRLQVLLLYLSLEVSIGAKSQAADQAQLTCLG